MRWPACVAVAVLAAGCNLGGLCLFDPCCPVRMLVEQRQVDFEGACPGPSCGVTAVGPTAAVPSLLPGDHALALDPGASITWTASVGGNGEGTSLAMSFRCDEGGALRLGGDGVTGALSAVDVDAAPDWRRRVWALRPVATAFETRAAALAVGYDAVVRVSNTGRARCAVDWMRFVARPQVCSLETGCSRTLCAGECVDLETDPQHCGACASRCGAGRVCLGGVCRPGSAECPGACDGRACGPAPFCSMVNCGACPDGALCADGRCVAADAGATSRADVVAGPDDAGVRFDAASD